ncbi:unnamed protein product [Caenorhabditis sp. 36 PRJEB53466]|nr:unnamed protein product [Caenorhabditis sp. 36 PRJEB53466]
MSGNKDIKDKKKKQAGKNSKGSQDDANENAAAEGKSTLDETFEKARLAVKNTVGWMTQTQAKPGGLLGYFQSQQFERSPPEAHKTYGFQANRHKNRNPDFPLYDASRFRLKIESESDNNYINASHVACPPCERKWIVAQHPMEAYYEDFWKMVFHDEIDVIVAIFSSEDGVPTYFPTEKGKYFNHGNFWVHCWKMAAPTSKNQAASYTIEVLPQGCSNSRFTTILHYPYWPKGLVAASPKVILKGIQALQPADKPTKGKYLIHSVDGINRAPCFVMVDYLVELMFRNNTVDITELITMLRSQRGGAFHNRVYCIYGLYVAIDYVKIRLTKFQSAPDILADVVSLQAAMKKEFATIIAKEPKGKHADVTIE